MTELERQSILDGHEGFVKFTKLVCKEAVIEYFAPITAIWRFLRRRLKA